MLLLSKVRFSVKFVEAEGLRGRIRPLTASHGLSQPRTLSLSQSNDWKQGQRVHGRPWERESEAVRGRERPWEAEFGLSSPRPHTICHVICLSQSEESTASHAPAESPILGAIWLISRLNALLRPVESDRPLTHTGRESDPRGYLTDFTAKRIASPGVRSVCVRGRSASHFGLSDRSHDLSESPKWEAVWEADRPLTHSGRCSPILG